ncbi:MAG: hypothetical protein AVDCRST_MAG04-405 [uncultured Acetobacteraceae bacterium]|uniref:Uncharacterized protein n=1 Tax=uncultured Acetobacteraceae bacterium TaxID=169975 RepID=A0A6J4H6S0_9PROT|nr:MAG: hypothetical protein AVDCRST_MAG04-405 [uncultured Acetobacteraceae bacterium]
MAMPFADALAPAGALQSFVALCGESSWNRRTAELCARAQAGSLLGRIAQQRHALELALARVADRTTKTRAGAVERLLCLLAQEAVETAAALPAASRGRFREDILAGLTGEATLIPLFHRLRTAALLRRRGFTLRFDGFAEGAVYDMLAEREGATVEVACETVSAEAGRKVNRGDWWMLVDRINPELQTWLAAHPGRYLLKMTLPEGLAGPNQTAEVHQRISALLAAERRQGACSQAVLKLDPLVLAGAQAGDRPGGLPARLREQFGPEAHLAVTGNPSSNSVFVMAARASQENEVAAAVCRRLASAAESRLTGRHPGILAVFLEDLDRAEWRALREKLELEGAVRRFLTTGPARRVVAVSCASRFELFGAPPPDGVADGELRFRNPAHPAAKQPALAPAILSSV